MSTFRVDNRKNEIMQKDIRSLIAYYDEEDPSNDDRKKLNTILGKLQTTKIISTSDENLVNLVKRDRDYLVWKQKAPEKAKKITSRKEAIEKLKNVADYFERDISHSEMIKAGQEFKNIIDQLSEKTYKSVNEYISSIFETFKAYTLFNMSRKDLNALFRFSAWDEK